MLFQVDQIRERWQRIEQDRPAQRRKRPPESLPTQKRQPKNEESEPQGDSSNSSASRLDIEA